jgi:hypothetical protein
MSPRRNWDSFLASECAPPPRTGGGGGAHSPEGEGLGEFHFRRLEKKLSTLPALWVSSFLRTSTTASPDCHVAAAERRQGLHHHELERPQLWGGGPGEWLTAALVW